MCVCGGGGGGGGLGPDISLEAKFGARFRQAHQIRGKAREVLKESQFWGQI